MTTVLAFGNQKGGVGKTTSAVNVAAWMAAEGKRRVLIVDLDSQGHVAMSLGMPAGNGLERLLVMGEPLEKVVVAARWGLDIVSNDHTAENVKNHAMQSNFRAYLLSQALDQAAGYDLVILDMPPSTDVLHVSALVASDYFIAPAIMDHLALTGVLSIIQSARALGKYPNVTPPALIGVLPTMFDKTTNETKDNLKRLAAKLGASMILPPVPRDTKIREASSYGKTIWEWAPATDGAIGYLNGSKARNSKGLTGGYLHLAEILAGVV